MNGYVVAAYLVILGSLAGYALYLQARSRRLERECHGLRGADTLSTAEDA